ncbi:MAG: hypothetical protein HGB18_01760 [Candidatus Moranbacteria bacterium]|nr:hypothetical protein [Candidatus Moranbacteria bacterium]
MERLRFRMLLIATFAMLSAVVSVLVPSFRIPSGFVQQAYVLGEDDEDDGEDDDGEDDGDGSSSGGTVTVWETRYETRQVTRTVLVMPEEYRTDSDGDRLVDALDPDPKVPQWEYFTDDDGDAVPNVFDRHPDEDDLAYSENGTDADHDGIVDAYGRLPVR